MIFAYIRVSTELQSYEGQRYEIEQWADRRGWSLDKWVQEKVSGTTELRKRTLDSLLKRMKKGDILICTELSRLGRNILNTCSQKGIKIYSIKDNFELSDSLNAKIIAFAFSLAAEIERNLISQRTREALAAKKQIGFKLGRPCGKSRERRKFEEREAYIREELSHGATISRLAKELGMHRNTLSRYLKENLREDSCPDFACKE